MASGRIVSLCVLEMGRSLDRSSVAQTHRGKDTAHSDAWNSAAHESGGGGAGGDTACDRAQPSSRRRLQAVVRGAIVMRERSSSRGRDIALEALLQHFS